MTRKGQKNAHQPPPKILSTENSLQAGENGECTIRITLTRVEVDITRLLGMEASTELCDQMCRDLYRLHVLVAQSGGNTGDWGGSDDNMGW